LMQVVFDTPEFFDAGDQFAIVVNSPGAAQGAYDAVGGWGGSTGPLYAGGATFVSQDGVNFFTEDGISYDLAFVTYVTVPEPSFLALLAVGCVIGSRRPCRRVKCAL